MNKKKNLRQSIALLSSGIIVALMVGIPSVKAIEFPTVTQRQSPETSAGGGRRGGCVRGNYPIKAFTPEDNNYIKAVSAQPQLFVYLPETKAKTLQFTLKDENGQSLNSQEIPVSQGDYIVKLKLPENINLETSKKYQWELYLNCNTLEKNTTNFTKGIFERVNLNSDVENQLASDDDSLKQAQIYANQGIWNETLKLVFTLKDSQPEQWSNLLNSVGLQDFVDKDFGQIQCSRDELETEQS